jgi:hypothetical protein
MYTAHDRSNACTLLEPRNAMVKVGHSKQQMIERLLYRRIRLVSRQ